MDTLITYDVSRRQTEVKRALGARQYHDSWESGGRTYYLPNTTLWKKNIDRMDALREIQQVIINLNAGQPAHNQIELERCICVPANPWAGITGKAHQA